MKLPMPYDLFISYSRCDNEHGRITQLVERIKADFTCFAHRELVPYVDVQEIQGMQDWRQRILQGLRESRLLLACLSPAYLQSEYCEWEFVALRGQGRPPSPHRPARITTGGLESRVHAVGPPEGGTPNQTANLAGDNRDVLVFSP
jgi:hypothetical protein